MRGRGVAWSGLERVSGAVQGNRDTQTVLSSLPLNGAEVTERARWSVRVEGEVLLKLSQRIRLRGRALHCVCISQT